ncbi:MAG: DNA mismatch repair endonuclease MutL [Gemmataceae bacterium]|nr:DNA mismatch repair endonuclease MutL [Gemmataceae bacterium]
MQAGIPRIRQLPPEVVTKIAAGEVIERPASVVKELLENSLDAGSRRIDIDVEQGGIERICVADDGCGIAVDDLPLAFASHATSKLRTADDLFQVPTLGFRGEALASIGAVAQVTLQSRPPTAPVGAEIRCHGGQLSAVRAWNGAPGTRLDVRHLFFNTPVRRKFLKSPTTEMGHVCEVLTRLALAQPSVHFTLRHHDRLVYEVPAGLPLLDRIGLFFGQELAEQLYGIEAHHGVVHLTGFVADPACERPTARMQYVFLNGRWIRDRTLGHALQEAYRGLLMTGRYAVAFLFLSMPPDQVDVNVHPTKAEVRFRDPQNLYHLVLTTVRERLRRENLTGRLFPPASLAGSATASWTLTSPPPPPRPLPLAPPAAGPVNQPHAVSAPGVPATLPPSPATDSAPGPKTLNGTPRAIQLYNTYLVVETPEGMLVIDQHALHERILYERLKSRLQAGPLETQRLLVPEPVELTAEQAAKALAHRDALAELGLEVAEFGGSTVLLSSYPALLDKTAPAALLRAVVDHLLSQDQPPTRDQLLDDLLALMACHAAVRAGDPLTSEEIAALVEQRHLAQDAHHCPHGRPTSLLFPKHDLERQFRRV